MLNANSVVAIFSDFGRVEAAIRRLREAGYGSGVLSVAGRDRHADNHAVGYYDTGEGLRCSGAANAFWGEVWATLSAWGVFVIPDVGPVLVAGLLTAWMATALKNAPIFKGFSIFSASLYNIGISRDEVREYEAALKAGRIVVLVHGAVDQVNLARGILEATGDTISLASTVAKQD